MTWMTILGNALLTMFMVMLCLVTVFAIMIICGLLMCKIIIFAFSGLFNNDKKNDKNSQ